MPPTEELAAKARTLLQLHQPGKPLVLPNAWDVATARIVEEAGFPAVATPSAGIGPSLGYPDGEVISREEMLEVVRRIARAISVPLTADLEAGYGDVGGTVEAALEAGAVGMNLEDGGRGGALAKVGEQVQRIQEARRAATALGVPFVLNARTDVFLLAGEGADRAKLMEEAIARGRAYAEAGADCVFVPAVTKPPEIAQLVRSIPKPLNFLAVPGCPTVAEFAALGAARISVGSGVFRGALTWVRSFVQGVRDSGNFGFPPGLITHREVDQLVGRRPGAGERRRR